MNSAIKTENYGWDASDYEALIAYGHSPAKAAEIVMDKERGDKMAREWILFVLSNGHQKSPHDEEQPDSLYESIKHEENNQ